MFIKSPPLFPVLRQMNPVLVSYSFKIHTNIILTYMPRSYICFFFFFLQGFLTKTLHVLILSLTHTTNLIYLDITILITVGVEYKLWKLFFKQFSPASCYCHLGPNILLSTVFSNTAVYVLSIIRDTKWDIHSKTAANSSDYEEYNLFICNTVYFSSLEVYQCLEGILVEFYQTTQHYNPNVHTCSVTKDSLSSPWPGHRDTVDIAMPKI